MTSRASAWSPVQTPTLYFDPTFLSFPLQLWPVGIANMAVFQARPLQRLDELRAAIRRFEYDPAWERLEKCGKRLHNHGKSQFLKG